MPAKALVVDKNADKRFLKLPVYIQRRVIHAYDKLKQNPVAGIKLHGEFAGYYKYRLGDYRIVYTFDTKTGTVEVVTIEHRQGVYK